MQALEPFLCVNWTGVAPQPGTAIVFRSFALSVRGSMNAAANM
jgi:hypothetical protein